MNQRGFIQLPMMAWGAIAAGAVIIGLTGAVYVQTVRVAACKAEYAKFVGGVEALGKAAQKAAQDKAAMDKIFKEKVDAENEAAIAGLNATIKRLRDSRPSRSFVPAAAPSSSRPDLACYDRAEYERETGNLVESLRGLADEGSKAAIDLNTAKAWATAH